MNQDEVNKVPVSPSGWYVYQLECKHWVLAKARINYPKSTVEYMVLCRQCNDKHTTNWKLIVNMKAATQAFVDGTHDAMKYVAASRILRIDGISKNGTIMNSGNPFPFKSKDSEV